MRLKNFGKLFRFNTRSPTSATPGVHMDPAVCSQSPFSIPAEDPTSDEHNKASEDYNIQQGQDANRTDNALCEVCRQYDWEYHLNRYWDGRLNHDKKKVVETVKLDMLEGATHASEGINIKPTETLYPGEYELQLRRTKFSLQRYRNLLLKRNKCSVCRLITDAIEEPQWSNDPNFKKRYTNSDKPVTIEIQCPNLHSDGFYSTAQMYVATYKSSRPISFQNLLRVKAFTKTSYPDPCQINPVIPRSWWSECKTKHRLIYGPDLDAHAGLKQLGKLRVIDVLLINVVSVPFDVDYVTLSYCWGASKVYKAIKTDFVNGELSLGGKGLPLTVSDVITFTVLAGERYLWVDSVCIVQDDPEDVQHYVNQMHNIYKAARFTIINASAT